MGRVANLFSLFLLFESATQKLPGHFRGGFHLDGGLSVGFLPGAVPRRSCHRSPSPTPDMILLWQAVCVKPGRFKRTILWIPRPAGEVCLSGNGYTFEPV